MKHLPNAFYRTGRYKPRHFFTDQQFLHPWHNSLFFFSPNPLHFSLGCTSFYIKFRNYLQSIHNCLHGHDILCLSSDVSFRLSYKLINGESARLHPPCNASWKTAKKTCSLVLPSNLPSTLWKIVCCQDNESVW